MACDTRLRANQTLQERMEETRRATQRLARLVASGTVKIGIGPTGAIAFVGWSEADRAGLSDACTYRSMSAEGMPFEVRQAIQRAEMQSGRKVNARAIAAGHHSHDGGGTWHKGH
jgi:hypothetical protein